MEGTLLVPPDRGTIIGRALWKTRYVVIGPSRGQGELPTNFTASQGTGAGRSHMTRSSNSNPRIPTRPEHFVLSIYKAKTDSEPLQQHSVSSITECQVQPLAHRKQGPVLPTLVVSLSPDATTDKLRKRRSSRTVGLTSKDNSPTTLLFRQAVSDQEHKLHDWAGFVNSLLQQSASDRALMSPITPVSPTFINPFASRNRDVSDPHQRPPSGNANRRTALQHKSSSHTHSSRERPVTYSDSPSLHSKRSDLSSHASSMNPSYMAFQNYATMHPADLPSPATTVGEYQGEFIEGWTSAQGRSSTISSPIRARDSIGSQPAAMAPSIIDSSSPPGPRETILDRAFQLRVIPGSERKIPGEEKLSSIARFDALMREADERRKIREVEEAKQRAAENEGLKSAWDLDEDSGSDQDEAAGENDDSDTNDYIPGYEHDYDRDDDRYEVRPGAQRARSYIGGRGEYRTQRGRAPLDYDAETLMALNSGSSQLRPQTGYSRSRPRMAQRTYSQPHLMGVASGQIRALDTLPTQRTSTASRTTDGSIPTTPVPLHRSGTEKRTSTSSMKRPSFAEFAKRLSSTSSLLLMPTNASGASSRSSDSETASRGGLRVASANPQQSSDRGRDTAEKRCSWRGGVGVFATGDDSFL